MKVKCPNCKFEAEYEGNPSRPFCSERCRLIDLGEWASESYRVPLRPQLSAENESESEFQTKTTHEKDPAVDPFSEKFSESSGDEEA